MCFTKISFLSSFFLVVILCFGFSVLSSTLLVSFAQNIIIIIMQRSILNKAKVKFLISIFCFDRDHLLLVVKLQYTWRQFNMSLFHAICFGRSRAYSERKENIASHSDETQSSISIGNRQSIDIIWSTQFMIYYYFRNEYKSPRFICIIHFQSGLQNVQNALNNDGTMKS